MNEAVRANPSRLLRQDIIDKVLLKDLPSLYGISDTQELNRFFNVLAFNTGDEVGLGTLSKHSGISKQRLGEYLEYLEAAFLIRRVHRIDANALRMKHDRTKFVAFQVRVAVTSSSRFRSPPSVINCRHGNT